jgi:hypothetical protein
MRPGPRFRALAERDGRLFAAADEPNDGYALGVSDDEGQTWKPLMRFTDVTRVKSCPGTSLPQACAGTCMRLAFLNIFQPQVCPFSGTADAGSSLDAAVSPDAGLPPPPPPDCGCNLGGRGGASGPGLLFLLVAGCVAACRARAARGRKPGYAP